VTCVKHGWSVTAKGRRYLALMCAPDDALFTLGNFYAHLGLIERRPEYLYNRRAVVEAIVAAEFPTTAAIRGAA
jgi:hypothetical protein